MSGNNFNNKYDYLCIYDFKISDDKGKNDKAYMICYMIMKYPKNIFSEPELNEFIEKSVQVILTELKNYIPN